MSSAPPTPIIGLSFTAAREIVISTCRTTLLSHQLNQDMSQHCTLSHLSTLGQQLAILIFIIICTLLSSSRYFYPGLIFSSAFFGLTSTINWIILWRKRISDAIELFRLVSGLVSSYEKELEDTYRQLEGYHNSGSYSCRNDGVNITSGHPRVSIITTYRNGRWQRIPLLLLAKGDIIALMGGDIAPSKVYELGPIRSRQSSLQRIDEEGPENIGPHRGKLYESGESIFIRKLAQNEVILQESIELQKPVEVEFNDSAYSAELSQPNSAAMRERLGESHTKHRSLAPENVELLKLSGDARLFEVAETPIAQFCLTLLNAGCTTDRTVSASVNPITYRPQQRENFLRALIAKLLADSWQYYIALVVVFISFAIIRLGASSSARNDWALCVCIPLASISIVFSHIAVPIGSLIGESLSTAGLLATMEAVLYQHKETSNVPHHNAFGNKASADTTFLRRKASLSESNKLRHSIHGGKYGLPRRSSAAVAALDSAGNTSALGGNRSNESDSDHAFHDAADIDERVEDMAEEISHRVHFMRFLQYAWKVFHLRIGVRPDWLGKSLLKTAAQPELLPVPLSRSRVVEVLGAITMVCFVDDDIVCENYSVAEEIFLLTDQQQQLQGHKESAKLKSPLPEVNFSGFAMGSSSGSEEEKKGEANYKGKVLDLHANPQASGSRFENPLWWRYLPSLKPIGLNAMLTYCSGPSLVAGGKRERNGFQYQNGDFSPTGPKKNSLNGGGSLHVEVEKSLVRYVQESLPFEVLRELSEEIGFAENRDARQFLPSEKRADPRLGLGDAGSYTRLLEVSVLAPRLENEHLLEDTHQWGQEESRRRGSLVPHLRSVVFQDGNKSGLQMMSLGDPALVLNYCREYWDGSTTSITPLTIADRSEVLQVYDRWRLEDFDVVGFAYNPIPAFSLDSLFPETYLQSRQSFMRPKHFQSASASQTDSPQHEKTHGTNVEEQLAETEDNTVPSVFFVDPCTPEDLKKHLKRKQKTSDKIGKSLVEPGQFTNHAVDLSPLREYRTKHPQSTGFSSTVSDHGECDNDEIVMDDNDHEPDCDQLDARQHSDEQHTLESKAIKKSKSLSLIKSASVGKRLDEFNAAKAGNLANDNLVDSIESVTIPDEFANFSKGTLKTRSIRSETPEVLSRDEMSFSKESRGRKGSVNFKAIVQKKAPNSRTQVNTLHSKSSQAKQNRRSSTRQLWTLLRQQVFLGMAASSVPVRADVPNVMEDLNAAGIRFVYFSPRNMKRSKPVAEKIGMTFDWNCAISLRELLDEQKHDPHRHISHYADWDVQAKMPHGIEDIKRHLKEVDNVPLLVSLYTDSTPEKVREMIEIFQEYGEVVLSVGGGYRVSNHPIFFASDAAASVATISNDVLNYLPADANDLTDMFSGNSRSHLTQADLQFAFQLVGIGSVSILQVPCLSGISTKNMRNDNLSEENDGAQFNPLSRADDDAASFSFNLRTLFAGTRTNVSTTGQFNSQKVELEELPKELQLSTLLEANRKGRIVLLNMMQIIAFYCTCTFTFVAWILFSCAVPINIPPTPPLSLLLIFVVGYIPSLCMALLMCPAAPDGIMKNTPRKRTFTPKLKDEKRYRMYLFARSLFVAFSVFLVGWLTLASTMRQRDGTSLSESMRKFYDLRLSGDQIGDDASKSACSRALDTQAFWLVQDSMATAALLCIISQLLTLLERGQAVFRVKDVPRLVIESFTLSSEHSALHVTIVVLLGFHGALMALRELQRMCWTRPPFGTLYSLPFCVDSCSGSVNAFHTYAKLDWVVWFALVLLPIACAAVGFWTNYDDSKHYRRHLQFLRLEFDTRLGMHSPR